jgi:hypothetical protein
MLTGISMVPLGLSADVADSGERRGGPVSLPVKYLTARDMR